MFEQAANSQTAQQEWQQAQAAQSHSFRLDEQAAVLAAQAIASACAEPAAAHSHSLLSTSATAHSARHTAPATPNASQHSKTAHESNASAATAALATGLQEGALSGLRTPVMLPPDAADLPVQAVLDELDTLLAKSDELRSSVQLRSSRNVSGQHTSTHLSRRNSFSVLDRPLAAAAAELSAAAAEVGAGGSILHSRGSTEWDEAARSSRRRSSSQPPSGRGAGSRSRSSSRHRSRGDGDVDDSFDRTMLDSTEARDEIRQHLQMVSIAAPCSRTHAVLALLTVYCTVYGMLRWQQSLPAGPYQ